LANLLVDRILRDDRFGNFLPEYLLEASPESVHRYLHGAFAQSKLTT
jgi:hypothetical protein